MSAHSGDSFAARIVAWQARHGRRNLPWQSDRDPYRVWLAEVMLQQTQVATVVPYFERFCARFPDVASLAAAPLAEVLAHWAGLGYYARARNLHACARRIVDSLDGRFPLDAPTLRRLPGIGRTTAAAIAAFCTGAREPILDGNVKRVLARHFGIDGDPGVAPVVERLWATAAALLPEAADMPAYTQGLMDLGATLCTRRAPACRQCPVALSCLAHCTGRVDQLPQPRPRRTLPQRRAWALLALHEHCVLLQQRAPSGLWGGLYVLPQFDSVAALQRAARAIDNGARLRAMAPRRHAFTHFVLTLLPRRLDVATPVPGVHEDDHLWLPLAEIERSPLPAPVLALLREVASAGAPGTAAAPAARHRSVSGSMPSATRKRDTML